MVADIQVEGGWVRWFYDNGQMIGRIQADPPQPPSDEEIHWAYTLNWIIHYQEAMAKELDLPIELLRGIGLMPDIDMDYPRFLRKLDG